MNVNRLVWEQDLLLRQAQRVAVFGTAPSDLTPFGRACLEEVTGSSQIEAWARHSSPELVSRALRLAAQASILCAIMSS